jgi:hypothetical protein
VGRRASGLYTKPHEGDTMGSTEDDIHDILNSVEDKKIRKKLYAQVEAEITFSTKSKDDAAQIVKNFYKRRGIVPLGDPVYESRRDSTVVTFKVVYKVHGGWRSDFIKKVESDANDTGVAIENLEVLVIRTEIPKECPRRECPPCDFATGKTRTPPADPVRRRREPVTVEDEEPETQSLWSRIRGGKR